MLTPISSFLTLKLHHHNGYEPLQQRDEATEEGEAAAWGDAHPNQFSVLVQFLIHFQLEMRISAALLFLVRLFC